MNTHEKAPTQNFILLNDFSEQGLQCAIKPACNDAAAV